MILDGHLTLPVLISTILWQVIVTQGKKSYNKSFQLSLYFGPSQTPPIHTVTQYFDVSVYTLYIA